MAKRNFVLLLSRKATALGALAGENRFLPGETLCSLWQNSEVPRMQILWAGSGAIRQLSDCHHHRLAGFFCMGTLELGQMRAGWTHPPPLAK
ncbi:MAG: hypothetical protein RBR15_17865 [Sphaerochaeta sp.]|nr:hypothetical protein [Sphaerochaeta sp.]